MDEMVLKRVPSKKLVDDGALGYMHEEEVGHLVEYYESNLWAVVTKLLLDPLDLTVDLVHISVYEFFGHK